MKKIAVVLFSIILVILVGCSNQSEDERPGEYVEPPVNVDLITEDDEREAGLINPESGLPRFTSEEVGAALDLVRRNFDEYEWRDIELLALWYDENYSDMQKGYYMRGGRGSQNGVLIENVIILLSDFHVGTTRVNEAWETDSTYENWNWILIRDSADGDWRIDDWGY